MLKEIGPETMTGDIAVSLPAAIPVFERHGIDFCCNGDRPLADAARHASADLDTILSELQGLERRSDDRDWAEEPLDQLLDFILETHHVYTKNAIQSLGPMAAKVRQVHGERHPEVKDITEIAGHLFQELSMHLTKEEQILFPMIRSLAGGPAAPHVACGPEAPMQVMEMEHEMAGNLLRRMRQLSRNYTPPDDACNTFRALYAGLEELEGDLHRHIHLENNVLHPRARKLIA